MFKKKDIAKINVLEDKVFFLLLFLIISVHWLIHSLLDHIIYIHEQVLTNLVLVHNVSLVNNVRKHHHHNFDYQTKINKIFRSNNRSYHIPMM
jgi:hypothetical protein